MKGRLKHKESRRVKGKQAAGQQGIVSLPRQKEGKQGLYQNIKEEENIQEEARKILSCMQARHHNDNNDIYIYKRNINKKRKSQIIGRQRIGQEIKIHGLTFGIRAPQDRAQQGTAGSGTAETECSLILLIPPHKILDGEGREPGYCSRRQARGGGQTGFIFINIISLLWNASMNKKGHCSVHVTRMHEYLLPPHITYLLPALMNQLLSVSGSNLDQPTYYLAGSTPIIGLTYPIT